MSYNFPSWLTKPMLNGVRGFNLDAYLLALEGWRRGLKLVWHYDFPDNVDLKLIGYNPTGKLFSLASPEKTHYFYRSRGDRVSNQSVDIASDKQETRDYLIKGNVDVPRGKNFSVHDSNKDVEAYINELGFPLVVKPQWGSLGKGVYTNLNNKDDVFAAINSITNDHKEYDSFVIETHCEGYDARLYVVGNKVVAGTKRLPAHVVGDGDSTIEELIESKNNDRMNHPHLSTRLIKVDPYLKSYLEKDNRTLETVPDKESVIYLNDKANVSAGGESINALETIPDHAKRTAVEAISSMPQMEHGGVDLIINEHQSHVIEINSTAGIVLHVLPSQGESNRVEKYIIDHYFPETMNTHMNEKLFFNYKAINNLLENRLANHVYITDTVQNEMIANRYIIKGKVQGVNYRNFIRRQANLYQLNGYVKNLKNGNVVVVVASEDRKKVERFKDVCYEGSANSRVDEILEYKWDKQINIGFEIRPS